MKKLYITLFLASFVTVGVAVYMLAVHGLNLGIDFRGGSVIELSYTEGNLPDVQLMTQTVVEKGGVEGAQVAQVGDRGIIIRSRNLTENEHQNVLAAIKTLPGTFQEQRFESIGPSLGDELRQSSMTAIIVVIIAIMLYISLVFRSMGRVVSPWAMGAAAFVSLAHDVVITLGIFAYLGAYHGVEINAIFVAVTLTILSYSISDTVIVFDRVRENVIRLGGKESFFLLVHKSIKQTLTRSINSSMTTILALAAIYLFGGESIKYFALALMIGIALGTYSSIFVASPVLMWWGRSK